jgi:adenylate cyclase
MADLTVFRFLPLPRLVAWSGSMAADGGARLCPSDARMLRMDIDSWEKAGLFEPSAPGADERRALLEFLTIRGATVDQMVEAHRLGRLPAVAGDLVMGSRPGTISVQEVADRCGVPVQRLQRVMLSLGISVQVDDRLNENWVTLMAAFQQGAELMSDDALNAFTRVLGAAATSIAEAAIALFYAELGPGSEHEGSDELGRAQMSETATLAFSTVPNVLSQVLVDQFDRANRRAAVVRGWGPSSANSPESNTGELVALGFVDLVDSTSWAEGLSLRQYSLALSRFESAAWSSAVLAGGRVIKMIGDEVFFAAPTADAACRIGTGVCAAAKADPLLPSARGAIGFGLATPREGDYFGPLVNLVSRLTKTALSETLIVTQPAADELPAGHWSLVELDPQPVRGLEAPVRVFAVTGTGQQPS